jgi:hypothetical protein
LLTGLPHEPETDEAEMKGVIAEGALDGYPFDVRMFDHYGDEIVDDDE